MGNFKVRKPGITAVLAVMVAALVTGFAFSAGPGSANAASSTSYSVIASQEAAELLVGEDIEISNVSYLGNSNQLGKFIAADGMGLPFSEGIILSTGYAAGAFGSSSGNPNVSGYAKLTALYQASGYPSGQTNDAAVLSFDITPTAPFLSFDYFFASTEYDQGSQYNDVFALWIIDDMGTDSTSDDEWFNIALLPNGNIVNIQNTVARNANGGMAYSTKGQYYNPVSSKKLNGYTFNFLGYTPSFTAEATMLYNSKNQPVVQVGKKVKVCMGIADAADSAYDSAVFIRANSVEYDTNGQNITTQKSYRKAFAGEVDEFLYLQPNLLFEDMSNVTCSWYVSTDGVNFTLISGEDGKYYYLDKNLSAGTYYYKAIMTDGNDTFESEISTIVIMDKGDNEIVTVKFKPYLPYYTIENFPSKTTVLAGETLPEFIMLEHDLYFFDGWYTDSAFTTLFDPTAPLTQDIVLYAKWSEKLEELTLDQQPLKLVYGLGDSLDLTGIKIIANYKSGASEDVTAAIVAALGQITLTEHTNEITFTYELKGLQASCTITVTAHELIEHPGVPATCFESGISSYYTCAQCDYATTAVYIPALGHDHQVTDHKDVTCKEGGYDTYVCSRCGDTYTDYHLALGHDYVCQVVKAATCTEDGLLRYVCSHCGDDYIVVTTAEHNFELVETKKPTCTEDGYQLFRCSVCHEEYRIEFAEEGQHDYQAHVEQKANKEHEGLIRYTCSYCGDSYVEVIPAFGEGTYVLLLQNANPWCGNDNPALLNRLVAEGQIAGWEMVTTSEFGNVDLDNYDVIYIANDQTTETYNAISALSAAFNAYLENGGTLVFGACGYGWNNGTVGTLPAGVTATRRYSERNYVVDDTHPIVTGGYTDGVGIDDELLLGTYCSHVYFGNLPAGYNVILQDSAGQPTLVEYACGNGRVIASGLTWEFYYSRTYLNTTSYAKNVYDDLIVYAASLADDHLHVYDVGTVVEPTCTSKGYTVHHCAECGKAYYDNFTDPIPHAYDEIERVDATCTENGYVNLICADCGHAHTEVLEALGHDLLHYERKDPTCTESGYEEHYECRRCDYTTIVVIPALGHNYAFEGFVWTEDNGAEAILVCTRDGDELLVAALVTAEVEAASCTEAGLMTLTATYEGHSETKEVELPALGHDWHYEEGDDHEECLHCHEIRPVDNTVYLFKEAVKKISAAKTLEEKLANIKASLAMYAAFDEEHKQSASAVYADLKEEIANYNALADGRNAVAEKANLSALKIAAGIAALALLFKALTFLFGLIKF